MEHNMPLNDVWIEKFKQTALPVLVREVRPERCILFGSRVRGNANEGSDIDCIVVAGFFRDIPFVRRMSYVLKKVRFEKHVDFLCYSPEEFERNRASSFVLRDALTYGEVLKLA
jgi:predicted nucleotidyltransferase